MSDEDRADLLALGELEAEDMKRAATPKKEREAKAQAAQLFAASGTSADVLAELLNG